MKKLFYFLFSIGIILCLLQVLLPAYFLTGDGPCHVYNAHLLRQWWEQKDLLFYQRFYFLNTSKDPNMLSHYLLALLMYGMSGPMAEKVLICMYLGLFISGFYLLLRRLCATFSLWPLALFTFAFHHLLAKGFYNFTFSIAAFAWLVYVWIVYLDGKRAYVLLLFFLLEMATFFTHPVAFVLGCVACASLLLSYGLSGALCSAVRHKFLYFIRQGVLFTTTLIPFILLLSSFARRRPAAGGIPLRYDAERLSTLPDFAFLVSRSGQEVPVVHVMAVLLISLLFLSLLARLIKKRGVHKFDGILLCLIAAISIYLLFPDWLWGGGFIVGRAQLFIFILGCCSIAYLLSGSRVLNVAAVAFFICFTIISFINLPVILAASRAAADYTSAASHIRPYATVVPLSFANNGIDEHGKIIATHNWLFCTLPDYMGLSQPLIIMDNYEANTGYFPLIWQGAVNPFPHMYREEGPAGMPQHQDIEGYLSRTGVVVDYVVTWGYDTAMLRHSHVRRQMDEVAAHYHVVYRSPTNRTVLYERKR